MLFAEVSLDSGFIFLYKQDGIHWQSPGFDGLGFLANNGKIEYPHRSIRSQHKKYRRAIQVLREFYNIQKMPISYNGVNWNKYFLLTPKIKDK